MTKVLSLVIPIKISKKNFYLSYRLANLLSKVKEYNTNDIEYIVVDSSSNLMYTNIIQSICDIYSNVQYIYCEMPKLYSAAKSRNKGVEGANGTYILFYDVDLVIDSHFLKNVFNDIMNFKHKRAFTLYPCLYLSESKTEILENKYPDDQVFLDIRKRYLTGKNDEVNYLAVNTSTILVNKKHFLDIGGYNESYQGHGYEDFELIHRLYIAYPIVERDMDYSLDYKTNTVANYQGFRKYYSYYAMPNFFKGSYTLHLWHPRPLSKLYYRKRKHNAQIFIRTLVKSMDDILSREYLDSSLELNFKVYIQNLIIESGYLTKECLGLFHFDLLPSESNIKKVQRKVRKFFLHPIIFFQDMIKKMLH